MNSFTIENVLEDIAMGLPAAVMECDGPEYDFVTAENGMVVIDGKMTIIAPTGQRFVVTVVEEK